MGEIQKGAVQIEDIIAGNNQMKQDIEYMKQRLNPTFVAKMEKTFQVI